MTPKNPALGKGLAALLGDWQAPVADKQKQAMQITMLELDQIQAGQYQPRVYFDEDSLNDLAQSIQAQGLLQPLTVRPVGDKYEIIAGERRWRACQKIGKSPIPVLIHQVSDETALALGLIENLQRQDLNPIEEAKALGRLIEEFSLTHQEIAHVLGQSRAHISNQLRLLQLEPEVQTLLVKGFISVGHARCLIGLDTNSQIQLAEKIHQLQWSVRMTEQCVQALHQPQLKTSHQLPKNQQHLDLANKLSQHWKTKFEIKTSPHNKGKVIIHYEDQKRLDLLLEHLLKDMAENA
jgi:ParB family transcriptional regulator, chromosome partitioning protein